MTPRPENDILDMLFTPDPREQEALPCANLEFAGARYKRVANIATALKDRTRSKGEGTSEECFDDHLRAGSHCWILGNDGANFSPTYSGQWRELLLEWLNRGCDIDYLFVVADARPGLQTELENLKSASRAFSGKLRAYKLREFPKPTDAAAEYLEQWRTFHFIVSENPTQLWVESYHPEGVTDAEDCYYFAPDVATRSALPTIYKSRFEHVVEHYGLPLV